MQHPSRLSTFAALALAGVLCAAAPASAVTFTVLHTFTGGADGAGPLAGLTIDKAGDLFGTAQNGGAAGYGTIFKLKRAGSRFTFHVLHTFASGNDGADPEARVVPGPTGRLYGTTAAGGGGGGTVFELGVPMKHDLHQEHALYRFTSGGNGYQPSTGDLAFDAAGHVYGTTSYGGSYSNGTVFELSRSKSGGWQETVLYTFGAPGDGAGPVAGVMLDGSGNLYGTTSAGGNAGDGTVFELQRGGSGWSEHVLYNFQGQNDGLTPYAGLTFDAAGNLYGAATNGGVNGGGTIFELVRGSGGWTFEPVYSTPGWGVSGPFRTPVVDAHGDIFGTTHCDGANSQGSVFELTPSPSGWQYTALHDFTGGSDGGFVFSPPAFDAHGNIFGTTQIGGSGNGVVWEVSP